MRHKLSPLTIAVAMAIGSVSSVAMAEEKPAGDNAEVELEALTVTGESDPTTEGTGSYTTGSSNTATRLGLSLRETPQSVSVVTQQVIQDQNLESLTEVVTQVTGVSAKAFDSSRSGFSARGFDITNIQVDGVATTWESGWSAGETLADPVLYDRIEIVRGASGLISGAGNPAAAINLVRKRADSHEFTGYTTLSAGSWDKYKGTLDVQSPLNDSGTVRGRFVASYTDEKSFVDVAENEKTVFLGTLGIDLTDSTLLNVGVSQQHNDPKGTQWGGLPVWFSDGSRTDWNRSKTTAPEWGEWSSEVTNYYANIEHIFDSGVKLYAAYSKTFNDADLRLAYLFGAPDKTTGLGMGASNSWYETQRDQENIDIYVSAPFQLFDQEHEITVGFMHNDQDLVTDRRPASGVAAVGNFFEWDGSYPEPTWGTKAEYTNQYTKQVGGYAVARLSLADPLKLIVGSRITNWEISGMQWNGATYEFDHHQEVTPYAGLIYDINDVYSTYVSYTDIFNPQNAQDRNGDFLEPLEGKNYEAGLKAEYLEGRVNAMVSVFRIEQDNLAQDDIGYLIPGTINQASYAAEGTTSEGFEVEVTGEITDNWRITAGWAQFQAEDADGEDVNTRFPRRMANLFTTYQIDQLTLGGGFTWESSNYTLATNPIGQTDKLKQDSYALVNLMARYQFSPELSAQLNVNNLFDEEYYSQIGFYSQLAYGAPRNANLSLRYDF